MNKYVIIAVTIAISSACLPITSPSTSQTLDVDIATTIDAIVNTAAAQTLAALPSSTAVVNDHPSSAAATEINSPSDTPTTSAIPNLTTTPATATGEISTNTAIGSQTPTLIGGPTVTPTLGVLTYGTLPAKPSEKIKIYNKSKVQAYISLQNCPPNESITILEYPVAKQVTTKGPLGYYLYVAWVGGREISGSFTLNNGEPLVITIYKDKITVTKG